MNGSKVVCPWRKKSLSACQLTQPLAGALLQDQLISISQLACNQEHLYKFYTYILSIHLLPVKFLLSSFFQYIISMKKNVYLSQILHVLCNHLNCRTAPLARLLCLCFILISNLHDEINSFCKQVAAENLIRKPCINWVVKFVSLSLQVLWPRSRTNVFGSNATGLSLPSSDMDLVVCLPPVRNLEPIKAGILEGRNCIKETCFQHAARYLSDQEWVKRNSLKIVENTAIPIIMLVVEVPHDLVSSAMSNIPMPKEADQRQPFSG